MDASYKLSLLLLISVAGALWPIPSQYLHGQDVVWIAPGVQVTYAEPLSVSGIKADQSPSLTEQSSGHCLIKFTSYSLDDTVKSSSGESPSLQVVETAVRDFYEAVFTQNIVPWMFHPRNADFEPSTESGASVRSIAMTQNGTDPAQTFSTLDGQLDESYTLRVSRQGQIQIDAASSVGISHALTTLKQLFFAHSEGGVYTNLAPIWIADSPKFRHRGFNLDVSRHFYPIEDIVRTIDAMAFNKLNRLHIHITDAQSWPLEIPALPELAAKGAYYPGATYSAADLQQIQQYGAVRGVETFIEVDMPGHTSSIWFSHPELVAAFNQQPDWDLYSAEPPSGTLKLNSSAVYDFLDIFWDDILPRVSKYTSYFHTGGDEVNFNASKLDETVQSNDPKILRPLLQEFFDKAHERVDASGMTHIVWEEMLLTYNLSLPSNVVVQSWLSDTSVASIVKSGHRAIAGNYDYWDQYLDCGFGQWTSFAPGQASATGFPYTDYCSPYKNWRLIYSYDPLADVPPNATDLVLGGEMSLWSEQTDAVSLDTVVWPRLSAAAEVLWSGAKDPQTGTNRSQIDAAPRISEMRERLVARGVRAAPVQMPFCTQNGTQCATYGKW